MQVTRLHYASCLTVELDKKGIIFGLNNFTTNLMMLYCYFLVTWHLAWTPWSLGLDESVISCFHNKRQNKWDIFRDSFLFYWLPLYLIKIENNHHYRTGFCSVEVGVYKTILPCCYASKIKQKNKVNSYKHALRNRTIISLCTKQYLENIFCTTSWSTNSERSNSINFSIFLFFPFVQLIDMNSSFCNFRCTEQRIIIITERQRLYELTL